MRKYGMSEALILASINPKYDDRLFVELRVKENYKFSTCCVHQIVLNAEEEKNDLYNNEVVIQ